MTKQELEQRTDHIENFIHEENSKLAEMISKIPTRDELLGQATLMKRLERIEKHLNLA